MSTTATSLPTQASARPLFGRAGGLWFALLGGLFVLLFWPFIQRMTFIATNANSWLGQGDEGRGVLPHLLAFKVSEEWSHALLIPFLSLYFVSQNRQRLLGLEPRPAWLGLAVFFLGLFSFAWWLGPGRNDMLQGYSMILALLGLVWFTLGGAFLRVLWFPVLYLALGVVVSQRWWDMLAWELRHIAAVTATAVINFAGAPVDLQAEVHGSIIDLWDRGRRLATPMNIADACAGLKILMTVIALGVAMAYLFCRSWWQRAVMVLATVPIAVGVNVGRIVVLAFLAAKVDERLTTGDAHKLIGLLSQLLPAAGLFYLLSWILERIVIYDDEEAPPAPAAPPVPPAAPVPGRPPAALWLGGGALGAGLTAALGASLAAHLALFRPDLFLLEHWAHAWLTGLFIVAVAWLGAMVAGVWMAQHRLRRQPGRRHALALALMAGVLLTSTAGLWATVHKMEIVLFRKPVPLRAALLQLPTRVGTWIRTGEDVLSPEQTAELGTTTYIVWQFEDQAQPRGAPGSQITLHVAYYTGTPGTVPHVPERCFTAGGLEPVGKPSGVLLPLRGPQYETSGPEAVARRPKPPQTVKFATTDVPATIFTFAFPGSPQTASNVVYFFAANGRFFSSPDLVRLRGFDLRDKYFYYCKIEVRVPGVGDRERAAAAAAQFLSPMMPEIMACLPDWDEVVAGRWPPAEPAR